jgi:hypothetical protein
MLILSITAYTPSEFRIKINASGYPAGIRMLQNIRSRFGLWALSLNSI